MTSTGDGEAAWMGYTLRELSQIATRVSIYCRWGDRFPLPERHEIAWAGVVDYLARCPEPPEPAHVFRAGMRAIGRASDRELREHGITRGPDGLHHMPRFDAFWAHTTTGSHDAGIIERLAIWQIWPALRPLHQMALLALAAHGDYTLAANATGYTYSTFASLISQARAAFLQLWHEGETPSHLWATDTRGQTDPLVTRHPC